MDRVFRGFDYKTLIWVMKNAAKRCFFKPENAKKKWWFLKQQMKFLWSFSIDLVYFFDYEFEPNILK